MISQLIKINTLCVSNRQKILQLQRVIQLLTLSLKIRTIYELTSTKAFQIGYNSGKNVNFQCNFTSFSTEAEFSRSASRHLHGNACIILKSAKSPTKYDCLVKQWLTTHV